MVTRPYRFLVLSGLFLLFSCTPPSTARHPLQPQWNLQAITTVVTSEGRLLKSIDPKELSQHVIDLGIKYDIDPFLILALIRVESNYNPIARSPMGALGLMQIMPCTLRAVGPEIAMTKVHELLDPLKNVHLGVHYLSFLKNRYQQNVRHALAAYNVGPARVDKLASRNQVGTGFYNKVMKFYHQYKGSQNDLMASLAPSSSYR